MDWGDLFKTAIVAIIAGLPGLVALFQNRKKNEAETKKVITETTKMMSETEKVTVETEKAKAETDSIHARVADRWAEHVSELMDTVTRMEKERELDKKELAGLRIDINQVRRENEEYRQENADLRDWAERLSAQFSRHLPDLRPEPFIRHPIRHQTYQPRTEE